jgi:hypothetical protein
MTSVAAQGQHRGPPAHAGFEQLTSKHFGGRERPIADLALVGEDGGMGNGSQGQNKAGDRPGVVPSSIPGSALGTGKSRAGDGGMADPTKPFRAHKRTRSAVANRPERLDQIDGRSVMYRRFKDVVSAILVDLGGADNVTEVKLGLVRRYAALIALAEGFEQRMGRGEAVPVGEYVLIASALVRLATRIGLGRTACDLGTTPSLNAYLAALGAAETKSDAEADADGETKGDFVSADEADA